MKEESDCTVSLQKMVIWVSKLNCLNNILQMSVKNYIGEQSMSHTELLNKKQQVNFHRIWVMWISPEATLSCSSSHDGDKTHTAIKIPSRFKSNKQQISGDKNQNRTQSRRISDRSRKLCKVSPGIIQRGLRNVMFCPLSRQERETNDRND